MTMHERMADGKLFTDMCEGLPEERRIAKQNMCAFNATKLDDVYLRVGIQLAMLSPDSGHAWIEPPFYFCYGKHIILGDGTYVNFNCNFVDDGMIVIGKNVMIGPAVTIATTGHPIWPDMREYMYAAPVTICDNVWIGGGATICPGVTIGKNSVIGAGSVVTKDIPTNVVAAGNPCRVLREIDERDKQYYFKNRKIDPADLEEEAKLRNSNM